MRKVLTFGLLSIAAVAVIMLAVWASGWTDALGLNAHGFVALGIGIAFTVGLGVGLMALVFHSSRSGHDDVDFYIGGSKLD